MTRWVYLTRNHDSFGDVFGGAKEMTNCIVMELSVKPFRPDSVLSPAINSPIDLPLFSLNVHVIGNIIFGDNQYSVGYSSMLINAKYVPWLNISLLYECPRHNLNLI